jgi:hypothetical protein
MILLVLFQEHIIYEIRCKEFLKKQCLRLGYPFNKWNFNCHSIYTIAIIHSNHFVNFKFKFWRREKSCLLKENIQNSKLHVNMKGNKSKVYQIKCKDVLEMQDL